MPKESEREKMLKLQVNFMANFLINEKKNYMKCKIY